MKFGKISIIGSGRVGTSTAFALICQNIAKEITLLDINEDVLDAESIDLRDAKYFSYTGHVHKGSWDDAKNSQIIVICAGEVLRPESSLHQVVSANKKCFDDIFGKLGRLDSKCVVVVATSPVDAMTQYAQKLSGLPKNQVFGTGTLLDTQRLRVKLGKKFKINEKSVHAYVMGEKGDTAFVPWSHATIAGRKLIDLFSEDRETQSQLLDTFVEKIKTKTDRMLWSKYGTNFGIAACIAAICKDIIYDCNSVLPLSCWVNDFGCYMSVLCTLGENGITKTLPLDLTDKEKRCFWNCSHSIWNTLKILGFQKEGFGAVGEEKEWQNEGWGIGEKKGVTEGLAPGGGLGTDLSGTGSQIDVGKGPEIGGGLGTDIGGFGKTSFEPLQTDLEGGLTIKQTEGFKQTEIGTKPTDFGTALSSTDIRGIDLGGKKIDVGTTDVGGLKPESFGTTETTGLGRDLGKTTDFGSTGTTDRGDLSGTDLSGGKKIESDVTGGTITELAHRPDVGATYVGERRSGLESWDKIDVGGTDIGKTTQTGIGKESSDIGGGLGTPSSTDVGGRTEATDLGLGTEKLGDTAKTPGMDTSFGGGPGISSDVKEGLQKDIGGGEFEKKKPLVTDSQEGRVEESVGRPIRQ